MLVFFLLAALAYVAAAVGLIAAAIHDSPRLHGWPRLVLVLAAVLHIATIGSQCVEGLHPFRSIALTLSTVSLFSCIGYLILSYGWRPMRELGALMAPIALVAMSVGFVAHASVEPNPDFSPTLIRAHILLATLGLAGSFLSFGVAALYLVLDRRLRHHEVPRGMSGLSVRGLDRLHAQLVFTTLPIFGLAAVLGAIALTQVGGWEGLESRALELIASAVAFIASLISVVGRVVVGLRGRRAAFLTLISFLAMVLIVVSYGVRT